MTAAELVDLALTWAREASAPVAAMPKGQAATDAQLRTLRTAIGNTTIALRKRIAREIGPAFRARPEAELAALDVDQVDADWKVAAGVCKDAHLSEILMGYHGRG